jgi:O-antigen/teichoic acid export membrane protein
MIRKIRESRLWRYVSNAFWLTFEKFFTLGLSMVMSIYIARYLQPESFGMLNYAISFVAVFSTFSALGVDRIMIRELSKDPAKKNVILGSCFVLKFIGSALSIVLIIFLIMVMDSAPMANTLILIIASAELFKAFDVVNGFYQSRVESKYVVRVQIVVNIVGNLLKVALLFTHASVAWFAAVTALNVVLNGLGFLYTYKVREGNPLEWTFNRKLALTVLRESWPVALFSIAIQTQAKIDQVLLGRLMNNYEVGQYSVAMKFIEMFGIIPMMLLNTFAPAVTKAKQVSVELYHERIVNFYRLMFVLFLACAIPVFFLGEWTIVLLYGEEYRPAGYLLSLFSIRLLFAFIGVGKGFYVINESLFKNSLLNAIVGATTNILVNIWLIPIYGSIGAIFATIVSFTMSTFVVDAFFPKTRENQRLIFRGIFTFWKLDKVT